MSGNKFGGERLESKSNLSRNNLLEHLARYRLVANNKNGVGIALDIGCGAGHGSNYLSNKFKQVYGVDLSPEAIDYAKKSWDTTNINFLCGSGTEIPFGDNFFDVVTAFEVFEHIEDWPKFLEEISRVVKKEGLVYISTPNKDIYNPHTKKPVNPHHFFEMRIGEFKDALNKFFVIKKFYGQRTPVYNDHWVWKIVNPILYIFRFFISYK